MHDLVDLLVRHGLGVVFAATFAARVGLPLPAAPLLVVAGGLAAAGRMSPPALLAVAVAANVAGDAVWFAAGRRWGYRVLGLLCRISISPDTCVRQSEGLIVRWGGVSLVAAKFVPGVSVVAAPMAGALAMPWRRFTAYALLAGAAWTAVFGALGAAFSGHVEQALDLLAQGGWAAAALLVVALAGALGWRWWRRRRARLAGAVPRIGVEELVELMRGDAAPVVIDVRARAAVPEGAERIPGALVAELHELPALAAALPRDREVVLYCDCPDEASAAQGAQVLAGLGVRRARPLAGGLEAWRAALAR